MRDCPEEMYLADSTLNVVISRVFFRQTFQGGLQVSLKLKVTRGIVIEMSFFLLFSFSGVGNSDVLRIQYLSRQFFGRQCVIPHITGTYYKGKLFVMVQFMFIFPQLD